MRQQKNDAFHVIDDFLPAREWKELWSFFQICRFQPVPLVGAAWSLADGSPLAAEPFITSPRVAGALSRPVRSAFRAHPGRFPTRTPVDYLVRRIVATSAKLASTIGDWCSVIGRPYVYPAGTSLSWHRDDHGHYAGAFIFYVHPTWNVSWGGELLLANDPRVKLSRTRAQPFDNRELNDAILDVGTGSFVMPKPNRLIVLGSHFHSVSPVRATAGSQVRASFSGFFLRQRGLKAVLSLPDDVPLSARRAG